MISLEKVEQTILELESADTSFAVCEKLAWCYIVRDHINGYSTSPEAVMALTGSSDFLQAINGKNTDAVIQIMDELMDAIQTLHPKMYDAVMDKIKDI